jgi:hypothetical protein
MKASRLLEALCGILASVTGCAAVIFWLTTPAYSSDACQASSPGASPVCTTSTATLLQVNGASAVVGLSIATILVVGIGIVAVWHSRTGQRGARIALWTLTVVLAGYAVLGILSIGAAFLASVLFALIACAFSFGRTAAAAT